MNVRTVSIVLAFWAFLTGTVAHADSTSIIKSLNTLREQHVFHDMVDCASAEARHEGETESQCNGRILQYALFTTIDTKETNLTVRKLPKYFKACREAKTPGDIAAACATAKFLEISHRIGDEEPQNGEQMVVSYLDGLVEARSMAIGSLETITTTDFKNLETPTRCGTILIDDVAAKQACDRMILEEARQQGIVSEASLKCHSDRTSAAFDCISLPDALNMIRNKNRLVEGLLNEESRYSAWWLIVLLIILVSILSGNFLFRKYWRSSASHEDGKRGKAGANIIRYVNGKLQRINTDADIKEMSTNNCDKVTEAPELDQPKEESVQHLPSFEPAQKVVGADEHLELVRRVEKIEQSLGNLQVQYTENENRLNQATPYISQLIANEITPIDFVKALREFERESKSIRDTFETLKQSITVPAKRDQGGVPERRHANAEQKVNEAIQAADPVQKFGVGSVPKERPEAASTPRTQGSISHEYGFKSSEAQPKSWNEREVDVRLHIEKGRADHGFVFKQLESAVANLPHDQTSPDYYVAFFIAANKLAKRDNTNFSECEGWFKDLIGIYAVNDAKISVPHKSVGANPQHVDATNSQGETGAVRRTLSPGLWIGGELKVKPVIEWAS